MPLNPTIQFIDQNKYLTACFAVTAAAITGFTKVIGIPILLFFYVLTPGILGACLGSLLLVTNAASVLVIPVTILFAPVAVVICHDL